jgi:hypothetical protein
MRLRRTARPILALAALLALAACSAPAPPQASDTATSRATDEGHFRIRYESELDPIVINQIHSWTVWLEDAEGQPIDDARIVVDGDMPEHQHGLPTVPEMTGQTGRGEYRIEGMKFSMPGLWEIELRVWSAGVTDGATFELVLE